jgi:hypothetical protein
MLTGRTSRSRQCHAPADRALLADVPVLAVEERREDVGFELIQQSGPVAEALHEPLAADREYPVRASDHELELLRRRHGLGLDQPVGADDQELHFAPLS